MREFTLGKYHLLAELARGGMGIVYLAVAKGPAGFSKLHILKELKPHLVGDAAFLAMFLEEARLAARLEHPNIVQTMEVGQEGKRHYIAMEYLQGQPLSLIRKRHPAGFTLKAELRVISEILRGLHHAHTLRDFDGTPALVIHRDVSPQNVFVTYDGQAKIVDFGIAKAADTEQHTQAGMFKGKAAYIAPEQVTGHPLDPRTDVFAAGVIIWEAIAGRRMWTHKNDIETLKRLLANDLPSLKEVKPDVDEELLRMVDGALAWKVEDRYASAEALAADIDAYLVESGNAPTMREIGDVLAAAFQDEREELRRIIEPQLAALKKRGPAKVPSLPRIALSEGQETGPGRETPAVSELLATDLASEQPIVEKQTPRPWRSTMPPWLPLVAAVLPVGIAAVVFTSYAGSGDPSQAPAAVTASPTARTAPPAASTGRSPAQVPAAAATQAPVEPAVPPRVGPAIPPWADPARQREEAPVEPTLLAPSSHEPPAAAVDAAAAPALAPSRPAMAPPAAPSTEAVDDR